MLYFIEVIFCLVVCLVIITGVQFHEIPIIPPPTPLDIEAAFVEIITKPVPVPRPQEIFEMMLQRLLEDC